jgi:hypothetical protein
VAHALARTFAPHRRDDPLVPLHRVNVPATRASVHLRALAALEGLVELLQLARRLLDPPALKQLRMHAPAKLPKVIASERSIETVEDRDALSGSSFNTSAVSTRCSISPRIAQLFRLTTISGVNSRSRPRSTMMRRTSSMDS